ncbi:hypothetical protein C8Q80DRAFT_1323946 [Daedaleopsis nitida]|nr:hypothetical protein C8Q80DRAFT_1323946 [Daedaleopsis nitida]
MYALLRCAMPISNAATPPADLSYINQARKGLSISWAPLSRHSARSHGLCRHCMSIYRRCRRFPGGNPRARFASSTMDDSRLPIELCERVIDVAGGEPWRGTGRAIDYAALRTCALVCKAWSPRARHNLFFRVGLRTARQLKLFLDVAATGQRTREMELTLPLRTTGPRSGCRKQCTSRDSAHREPAAEASASLASPLLAHAVRGVRVLALHYSEWLYPRAYIRLLGSQFAAVTTLDLYCVTFTTGGDLARVVWGFPNLQRVHCGVVVVKYGGTHTLPVVTPGVVPCRKISDLRMTGCSSIAPFILKTVTAGSAPIATLSLRSSFARWAPDGFESFSAFGRLRTLRVVLASPAVFSPLPLKSSLLEIYAKATRRILSSIASADTPNDGLRLIDIACEPGSGRWRYLCGTKAGDVATDADAHVNANAIHVRAEAERRDGHASRGIENILLEGEELRRPFAGLRVLNIRLWDPLGGKDDQWWLNEVAKSLPALYARGILSLEVVRTSYVGGGPLWDPEDE